MSRTVFLTGCTGALGPALMAELLGSSDVGRVFALIRSHAGGQADRVRAMSGDIRQQCLGLNGHDLAAVTRDVEVIIHAAANTSFVASRADLYDHNVAGTARVLELAQRCGRLRQLVFVSTACVAGTRTGNIPEQIEPERPGVVTAYEESKWEAEQVAASSGLPIRIARLSTCVGDSRSGRVHRLGAFHQSLRWFLRGLIPMVPGVRGSSVDLISTDFAARWLARSAARPADGVEVCHVAAGQRAVPLPELLTFVADYVNTMHRRLGVRRIDVPAVVDADTFDVFTRLVADTGDPVFRRVLRASGTFFPALMYPKSYRTDRAEQIWGGPFPELDWRVVLARVIDFIATQPLSLPKPSYA